ncbi:hypothetical protein [Chryseosolibacter indicus]|uniref:DUF4239 domain-containing protein n=1 Tax=Chryseosolibacter indicus TaxID=2782351 RepID=A0ABS5VVA3_9BACT|nr:hypothetical protein [Chryseosolibacter indicus]MBT1704735.1 hypothetical protein [Chryseosolibacter indicus]
MTGFEILDLVIGMIFIYFLLSLLCVSILEAYARFLRLRSNNLKKWLTDTFNDKKSNTALGERIWCNVMVDGLTQDRRGASYLSRNTFVHALLDEIHYGNESVAKEDQEYAEVTEPYDFYTLKSSILQSKLLSTSMKRMLLQFHHESFSNIDSFKLKIATWFDEAMERNSGTYKSRAQNYALVISFVITILLNVDSLKLFSYFYVNKDVATKLANAAQHVVQDTALIQRIAILKNDSTRNAALNEPLLNSISHDVKILLEQQETLTELNVPIGWNLTAAELAKIKKEAGSWFLLKLLGWVVTAIAVSLGAPFWFDTLNKLVNIRSAGKKPQDIPVNEVKSTPSASEKALA